MRIQGRKLAAVFSLVLPGLCAFLLGASPAFAARIVLQAKGPAEQVPVGQPAKNYLVVGEAAVAVPLKGPGTLTGYARVALPTEGAGETTGVLHLAGVPGAPDSLAFVFKPSKKAVWGDDRSGRPSGGRKFSFEVPAGEHVLQLRGESATAGALLTLLYYEGPAQPGLEAAAAKAKAAKPRFSWVSNASLDVIYNDNILSNSPGYNDDFIGGFYPWKFLTGSKDDLIVAAGFDIEARSDLVSWGQSRLKFKVKHWQYTHNPIKTNTDFHFHLRQFFGRNQSLEGYFHFAPEQYIRQLSDRSPLSDPDVPINWTEFRFQRNVWNLTWRQKLSKRFTAKILYEENYRYYNQPFIENDITAWEVRGNLTWKLSRVLTWNFDYSYEDAQARALDEPHENPLTSDNSDASYARDLYRIGVDIRHPALRKVVDRVSLSFLFMDYYYTTTKSLAEDPYHAGRRDMFYKGTVEVRRNLFRQVMLKLAVRRTERVVDSPWEGDITTDKDFTQWLYWTSLNYRF